MSSTRSHGYGDTSPRRQRRGSIEAGDTHYFVSRFFGSPRRQRRGSIEAASDSGRKYTLQPRHRDGNVAAPLKRRRDDLAQCSSLGHRDGNVAAPLKQEALDAHKAWREESPRRQRRGSIEAHCEVRRSHTLANQSPRRQRRGSIEAASSASMRLAASSRHRDGNVAAPLKHVADNVVFNRDGSPRRRRRGSIEAVRRPCCRTPPSTSPRRQRRGSIEARRRDITVGTHERHRDGNVAAPLKHEAAELGGVTHPASPRRQRRGSIEARGARRGPRDCPRVTATATSRLH